VRFKVIMLCNNFDGELVYQPAVDLLSKKKPKANQTGQNTDSEDDLEEG
jgi:hypothetical protein